MLIRDRTTVYGPLAAAIRARVESHCFKIKRILVVDDSRAVARRFKALLHEDVGFIVEVATASPGDKRPVYIKAEEIVRAAIARGEPFDLVISDTQLDTLDATGKDVIATVKRLHAEVNHHLKAILMGGAESTDSFPNGDVDAHMEKTLRHSTLIDLLLLINKLEIRLQLNGNAPLAESIAAEPH